MKHLVFLDRRAGELEKILSGIKTMLIKDLAPAQSYAQPVSPGDHLYFLRDHNEYDLRVTAIVLRTIPVTNTPCENLAQVLKEMQPRLQLTEDQYNHWSVKQGALLVEFGSAHKIDVMRIASNKIPEDLDWITFEELHMMT